MEDKIQAFRQPMVTATGIMLGFILNFAALWVKADSHLSDALAYLVGLCIVAGVICLVVVLSRVLRFNYPKDEAEQYYNTTLKLFLIGVSVAFVGVMIDMFGNFMMD
jgi:heme/copper-type cytochrome/quinol oxidase subunit 4